MRLKNRANPYGRSGRVGVHAGLTRQEWARNDATLSLYEKERSPVVYPRAFLAFPLALISPRRVRQAGASLPVTFFTPSFWRDVPAPG